MAAEDMTPPRSWKHSDWPVNACRKTTRGRGVKYKGFFPMPRILIIRLVLIAACFLVAPATAETGYGTVQIERIVSVYDGDTFRADIAGWPDIIGKNMPVRVNGVDTPEIRGKCNQEKILAKAARDRARVLLQSGAPVFLENIQRGKYFRLLASVRVGEHLLSDILITENFGRFYDGEEKKSWCEK